MVGSCAKDGPAGATGPAGPAGLAGPAGAVQVLMAHLAPWRSWCTRFRQCNLFCLAKCNVSAQSNADSSAWVGDN
ncbi:MAG: hypothetical protein WKF59_17455 [Chitinophagaceae bacterium]